GFHNPELAAGRRAFPLVDSGAIANAACIQIQHLAGEAVFDAVDAFTRTDKAPLLPFGIGVVPQLDASAVIGVVVSHFDNLAVGGADGIELVFLDHSLSNFLCCHWITPPKRWCVVSAAGATAPPGSAARFLIPSAGRSSGGGECHP